MWIEGDYDALKHSSRLSTSAPVASTLVGHCEAGRGGGLNKYRIIRFEVTKFTVIVAILVGRGRVVIHYDTANSSQSPTSKRLEVTILQLFQA